MCIVNISMKFKKHKYIIVHKEENHALNENNSKMTEVMSNECSSKQKFMAISFPRSC